MNKLFKISILAFAAICIVYQANGQDGEKVIRGGILNGKAVSLPKPEYPAAARSLNAKGTVSVQVLIDEAGNIVSATALSGHPLLRSVSEQAALGSKFSPTLLSGNPVRVSGVITYNFVAPQRPVSNEERLAIMAVGMFLTISEFGVLDISWESLVNELISSDPPFAKQLLPLKTLNKNTPENVRLQVLSDVRSSVEQSLDAGAQQFRLGVTFGEFMLQLRAASKDANLRIDESLAKLQLRKIDNELASLPDGFPFDVVISFKKLTAFADASDLNEIKNKQRMALIVRDIIDIIAPRSIK